MSFEWRSNNEDGPTDLTTEAPHFFKIIMPQTLQERKLVSKYGVHLSDTAFLTIPNGTNWKFKLTKRDGEVWFQNGWCEFASCHTLTPGHLLVFKYEGNSQFYVLIFDATTTKIDYPLDDQLQVRRMEDNESDDNSLQIMDGFMPSQKTSEKPPLPCPLMTKPIQEVLICNPLVKLESDCNLDDVSSSHDQCPKKDGGVGISTNGRRLKGKALVKNQEYKALESKQELMTTNGKAENLVRANAFKSENALFTVIIHPSYLNGKDCASLPHGSINYLPRKGCTKDYTKGSILTVKLQVVDRLWPVKLYVYEGMYRSSSCIVSGGWSAFVTENTLRVGDVCVFELIMRDDAVLKVHIFRCLD
ncbi:hypothetical protein ACJW30_08G092100 [Castanea mollissima]